MRGHDRGGTSCRQSEKIRKYFFPIEGNRAPAGARETTLAKTSHDLLNDASVLSLRCFVAVVDTQSFSSAARQLRLSTSSVTKHVQLLERVAGSALLHRTTRRSSITEAGEAFYPQCVDILNQLERAVVGIASAQKAGGHLRVAAPPAFASTVVAPRIAGFLASHPGASLDLIVTATPPDVVKERTDVAIVIDDAPANKQPCIVLAESPRVLCASPAYLAAFGVPASLDELETTHHCLCSRISEVAVPWTLHEQGQWRTVRPNAVLLSDNGEALRRACMAGAGLGVFYRFHVGDDLERGSLVEVLPRHPARTRTIHAMLPHRKMVRPLVQSFTAFLKGALHD